MNVVFKTNIDAYKTNCFPNNLGMPPRIGEKVLVTEVFEKHFSDKKLPLRLEVTDVTWTDKGAVCELHYNETDLKICIAAGGKPYGF